MKNLILFGTFLFLIVIVISQKISYGQGRAGLLSFDTDRVLLVSDDEKSGRKNQYYPARYVRMFTFNGVRCITVERLMHEGDGTGTGVGVSCDWD